MGSHAIDRLEERYDPSLSDAQLRRLRKMVGRGQTEFVRRGRGDCAVRRALLGGVTYTFVWSYRSGDFVTFLPEGS
jgi:hypothetical protein